MAVSRDKDLPELPSDFNFPKRTFGQAKLNSLFSAVFSVIGLSSGNGYTMMLTKIWLSVIIILLVQVCYSSAMAKLHFYFVNCKQHLNSLMVIKIKLPTGLDLKMCLS